MVPTLSLALPVYNVGPYLAACLDSVMAMRPMPCEIVVVDDGSTDDSPSILASYVDRLPQMRIIRQDNAGTAAARNAALAVIKGTHVAFLDPDDFVAPHYYDSLFRAAVERELDLAIGNATYHFEGRCADRPIWDADDLPTDVMAGKDLLKFRLRRRTMIHLSCLLVYRRAFLEKHGLRYPDRLAHEDVIWLTEALVLAERAAWVSSEGYFYRQRIRRQSGGAERDRNLLHVIDSSTVNARTLSSLAEAHQVGDPELARLLRWQLVDGGLSIFHKLEKISDPALRQARLRALRHQGDFALLWRNATEFRQRRKLARRYLSSFLTA